MYALSSIKRQFILHMLFDFTQVFKVCENEYKILCIHL